MDTFIPDSRVATPASITHRTATGQVVMVVDDVPGNIRLMQALLEKAGYQVVCASDGPSALALAEAAPPDLILLDVRMPLMDGFDVCARLKAMQATRQIPVVFMTAGNDAKIEAQCFEAGAADYITKPIVLPVVLARVKAHLALYDTHRRLEGMFKDVVEFAPDAMILADPQRNILQVNAAAELVFGYPRHAMQGQPLELLIPNTLRLSVAVAQASPPREGHPSDTEDHPATAIGRAVIGVRSDGRAFAAEVSIKPLHTQQGEVFLAVVRDITLQQEARHELERSRQRVRDMAAQNEAAREEERKHVAREVHDELGQVLTALRMDITLIDMRFGSSNPALNEKVATMKTLVDRAIQGVRNVAGSLRPTALDVGLVPALQWLCSEFVQRHAVPCRLHVGRYPAELSANRSVVVFRIVQESLTNVSRYAKAGQVNVSLDCEGDEFFLQVRDDGCGFDVTQQAPDKSFGLLGMRERALALGGEIQIDSQLGQGTCIAVKIPLHVITQRVNP